MYPAAQAEKHLQKLLFQWIEKQEAIQPQLRPLHNLRFGQLFQKLAENILAVIVAACHGFIEILIDKCHILQLAGKTLILFCHLAADFLQELRRNAIAFQLVDNIPQLRGKAPLSCRPGKGRQALVLQPPVQKLPQQQLPAQVCQPRLQTAACFLQNLIGKAAEAINIAAAKAPALLGQHGCQLTLCLVCHVLRQQQDNGISYRLRQKLILYLLQAISGFAAASPP